MTQEPRRREDLSERPAAVLARIERLTKQNDWAAIERFTEVIPRPLEPAWLEVADAVAFALGRLRETDRAAALGEAAFDLAPTRRRAASVAYVYYDALLGQRRDRGRNERDREADRAAFRRWIGEALRREPGSIKDLYRLGVYEAQVEHLHDKAALRAFLAAIASFRRLSPGERARRGDLHKYFVKSLYAGARSALRLDELGWARQLVFECVRENEEKRHVAPLHVLFLAGKVCAAMAEAADRAGDAKGADWAAHAERAWRKALDAEGPPRRDFVVDALARLALARGRVEDAERWIEELLPPHRRKPHQWRLMAAVRRAQGRPKEAFLALQNSLKRDKTGRHLTLTLMGEIQLELGQAKAAERSFRKAQDFRRKRYLSDHRDALRGLAAALEARGRREEAAEARARLEQARAQEGLPPEGRPGGLEDEEASDVEDAVARDAG